MKAYFSKFVLLKAYFHCMKFFQFSLFTVVFVLVAVSCIRDDDEPIRARNSISRLYVSFSDFQPNTDQRPYDNVMVIDPADSDKWSLGLQHTSEAIKGSSIFFYPFSGLVFQTEEGLVAGQDTMIYVMAVGETGVLDNRGKIINNQMSGMKGLAYYKSAEVGNEDSRVDNLYAASLFNSTIYVFDRPNTYSNKEVEPIQIFRLKDVAPWKILLVDKDMFMAKTGENGGVAVYKALVDKRNELIEGLEADLLLTVKGANNIRGIDYDPTTDMLVLTDYVAGDGGNSGRLIIIDGFSEKTQSGEVTPSRVVSGDLTELREPVDIEIDKREGAEYMYVADKAGKKILRFLKEANGNIAPQSTLSVPRTPAALSLDARGAVSQGGEEDGNNEDL